MVQDEPEADAIEYIQYVFKDDELLKHATNQLRNSVLRNCLKETYELINLYGNETGQSTIVKAAPWYQFLRIVRNCLSHDMKLRFRKADIKHLPVTWGGLTFDESMQNKSLPMRNFLSRPKAFELIDSIIEYTENKIN